MLKRCSDNKDMTEWNDWRKANPDQKVLLEGANLNKAYLREANLRGAFLFGATLAKSQLNRANFEEAILLKVNLSSAQLFACNFEKAKLGQDKAAEMTFSGSPKGLSILVTNIRGLDMGADLENSVTWYCDFRGANLSGANLKGTDFKWAVVDGSTKILNCKVDRNTDFREVGLDSIQIDPGTKQLLECNIRRKNWGEWYKEHPKLKWVVKPFWLMSDYGRSTGRIGVCFVGLAIIFAVVYWLWSTCLVVDGRVGDVKGFMHALYLSVMVMIGVGDIGANPYNVLGQVLFILQVILGYVILAALVTRFAVLFTAGGPSGRFADEKTLLDRLKEKGRKLFGKLVKFIKKETTVKNTERLNSPQSDSRVEEKD